MPEPTDAHPDDGLWRHYLAQIEAMVKRRELRGYAPALLIAVPVVGRNDDGATANAVGQPVLIGEQNQGPAHEAILANALRWVRTGRLR